MHATLPLLVRSDFPALRRRTVETLQVNLGYRCNQSCLHCHVNAGPNRTEEMSRETIDAVITFLAASPDVRTLDLTGGAPELNRHFRALVVAARARGVAILPVDSEHNAIHQCLHGRTAGELRRLILTASGGPFRGRSLAALEAVTAEEALKHPTWQMGPKITIDSATLGGDADVGTFSGASGLLPFDSRELRSSQAETATADNATSTKRPKGWRPPIRNGTRKIVPPSEASTAQSARSSWTLRVDRRIVRWRFEALRPLFCGATDGRTLVPADHVGGRDPVLEEWPDRIRVEPGDVIAFKERVHDQLPVRFHYMRPSRE